MGIYGLHTDKYRVGWIRGQRSSSHKSQVNPGYFFFLTVKPLLLAGDKMLLINFFDSKKIDFDIHSRKL